MSKKEWNDFNENVSYSFGKLRDNKEFTDLTRFCKDGQQMEAHKVILGSSSPFLLLSNTQEKQTPSPSDLLKRVSVKRFCFNS